MNFKLHVERLKAGESTKFRPHGNSMKPIIESGNLVTVEPITRPLAEGDVVLCRVSGNYYVHLVKAIQEDRVLIGNNRGHINGWTHRTKVYGRVTKVES